MVIEEQAYVEVEVLTPVHIWSGEEWIKNIDYCYDSRGGKTYILDPLKLAQRKLLGKPVTRCPPFPHCVAEEILTHDNISGFTKIKKHMRIGDSRLIPGSSIKGLIRTAFLYTLLKYKLGSAERNSIIQEIVTNLQSINTNLLMNRMKDVHRAVREVAKPVEQQLKHVINDFTADAFSRLIVTDPLSYRVNGAIRLVEVYEVNKLKIRRIASTPLEVIDARSHITYKLGVLKRKDFKLIDLESRISNRINDLVRKYSLMTINDILYALNKFSVDTINYELGRVKDIDELRDYKRFLQNMLNNVGENIFYLKIGFMAGHKFKTVDLALDSNTLSLLRSVMSSYFAKITRGRIRIWDDKTLKLTRFNGKFLGIGWIKVVVRKV